MNPKISLYIFIAISIGCTLISLSSTVFFGDVGDGTHLGVTDLPYSPPPIVEEATPKPETPTSVIEESSATSNPIAELLTAEKYLSKQGWRPEVTDDRCVVEFPKTRGEPHTATEYELMLNRNSSLYVMRFENTLEYFKQSLFPKCEERHYTAVKSAGPRPDQHTAVNQVTRMWKERAPASSIVAALKESCRWVASESSSGEASQWALADTLRKAGYVRSAFDCIPTAKLKYTCYHHAQYDHYFSRGRDISIKISNKVVKSPQTIGATTYSRKYQKPWFSTANVCMTCETEKKHWMDPSKFCHATLWSVGSANPTRELEAKHRGGRHALWYDREGGFQFGGIVPSNVTRSHYYHGTTIFLPTFSNNNVGHCLHDAFWAFMSVLLSLDSLKMPKPFRVMADETFFDDTCPYFSVLASLAVKNYLPSGFIEKNPTTVTDRNQERVYACFEKMIFTGSDRKGIGSGQPEGRRWNVAGATRRMVFDALGVPGHSKLTLPRAQLRVALYSRRDVYRRSFDNFGALLESVTHTLRALQQPDPIVITSFSMSSLAQIRMVYDIDILVTVQGSHIQNSLFMPPDAWLVEVSPCLARSVSFLARYGMFLPNQKHVQLEICAPILNLAGDKHGQNLTLCPHHFLRINQIVTD
eukprot:PhF_6_TR35349/c0_g2_i2/m.51294